MGLKERFEQFKAGTTHKLVQVFSKKYQPTFEEVQHHVDHTYGKKAEAIITLNGTISYFSESYIDEVQQYVREYMLDFQKDESKTPQQEYEILKENIDSFRHTNKRTSKIAKSISSLSSLCILKVKLFLL